MTEPKLTDEQILVLEYIRQNPNENAEEVIISFCGWDESHYRETISSAIGYLTQNNIVDENPRTKQLAVRIGY